MLLCPRRFIFFVFILALTCSCAGTSSTNDEETQEDDPSNGSDDDNDDLSDPGNPAVKTAYTEGLAEAQGAGDHFDFNSNDYTVTTESFHGTTISVAVHAGNPSSLVRGQRLLTATSFASYVIDVFHKAWHVFGGFKYDRYAVLVRSPDRDEEFSLSPVGVSLPSDSYDSDAIYEFIAHEMFHAWIGKLVQHEPDGSENLFQAETWISEGSAVYYGIWLMGQVRGESSYESAMEDRKENYEENGGGALDLSIQDLANLIGSDFSKTEESNMLYARAGLLNYLLDLWLIAQGTNLDAFMQAMYENFGLADTQWQETDLSTLLTTVAGISMDDFLANDVLTNSPLSVGEIQFLEH